VGVLLAVVAFHAVEQPCRRFVPMRVLAVGFVLCVCVCVVVGQRRPVADPMGLFERTSFTSPALSVTRWTESEMDWGSLRDLALPPVPKIAADQWTQGGIIHSWEKGHAPRVVVIGSSHALMFASLIDDICRRLGMSVAFLAAPATPVFFPTPIGVKFQTAEAARSFDAARRKWIAEWRPDVIVVADRWDNHFERPGQLARELRGLAEEFAPMTKRMIVINQVPVLRLGERENLREYATWYWRRFGRLPVIREDARGELRRAATSVIRELGREFPHVELLDLGRLYAGADGAVRYVEGRRFLYVDDDHLSDAGAELARAELTRAISR
jgi:hypothetical protein